jgi:hypothetical protein
VAGRHGKLALNSTLRLTRWRSHVGKFHTFSPSEPPPHQCTVLQLDAPLWLKELETDASFILMYRALGCQGFINGSPSQGCLTLCIKQEAYYKDIFMNLCRIYDKKLMVQI